MKIVKHEKKTLKNYIHLQDVFLMYNETDVHELKLKLKIGESIP